MSKKPPETSPRKPRTAPRHAKPKTAPAPEPVAETTVAMEGKVEAVLNAPKITPEEIVHLLRSGNFDSSAWAGQGYTVELLKGQIFISKRSGCVTKKLIDGAPLRLPVERLVAPTAVAPASIEEEFSQDEMSVLKSVEAEAPAPVVSVAEPVTPFIPSTDTDTLLDDDVVADVSVPQEPATQPAPTSSPPQIEARRTKTPPLGTPAAPFKEPKVAVPFLEAETRALKVDDVQAAELARIEELRGKVGKFEERFASLNKQAQRLLNGKPDPSDTDIPTIITVFNSLTMEATDLLNSCLAGPNSNEGLIRRLGQLMGNDIKGVVVKLRAKQQNGVEAEFYDRKADSEVAQAPVRVPFYARRYKDLLLAASVLIAAGIVGTRTCAKSDSPKSDEQKVSAPAVPPEESAPTPPLLEKQPTTDLNLESVDTVKPSAPTTATFNCEVNTTDTAWVKCVKQGGTPDADIEEKLAWVGQYDDEKKTIPAKLTLVDPDGNTFEATFEAQVGTRKKLDFTLEAQSQ